MARFWILLFFMAFGLSGKVESKKKRKFLVQVKEKESQENTESGENYGKDLILKLFLHLCKHFQGPMNPPG